jgi:hypothetical protein
MREHIERDRQENFIFWKCHKFDELQLNSFFDKSWTIKIIFPWNSVISFIHKFEKDINDGNFFSLH